MEAIIKYQDIPAFVDGITSFGTVVSLESRLEN